jgi:hypothetical protein
MRANIASGISLLSLVAVASADWSTYTVPHVEGQDDTPALQKALDSGAYSSNAQILFQKGNTYNIWTPLVFPKFTNVEIAIEGNLTYPTDVATIQSIVGSSVRALHFSRLTSSNPHHIRSRASKVTGSISTVEQT